MKHLDITAVTPVRAPAQAVLAAHHVTPIDKVAGWAILIAIIIIIVGGLAAALGRVLGLR
jgi:hypothetical protein